MGVTLRSMILAGILIIMAAIVYRLSVNLIPEVSDETLLKYPTFIAKNFHGENYNEEGQLTAVIDSPHVEYFEKQTLITLEKPTGVWHDYHNQQQEPNRWQIKAMKGSYIIDSKASLEGSIVLTPLHQDPTLKKISTEKVDYNLITKEIFSDRLIVIEGQNFINYGTGFKVDLNTDTITISGEPHARYYPAN